MDPILGLIAPSHRLPPDALEKPAEATPFFQVNSEGFLLRAPSGGRMHYAPGQGIALLEPDNRPAGDLQPFVVTSGFAAAAWLDGRVPLSVNAVQLPDQRLLLIASDRDDLHESLALTLADTFGLALSDAPVVIDPEDPTRVCTNGQPFTQRRTAKDSPYPPVREGARRLRLDRPTIDGTVVHVCAGLICAADAKKDEAEVAPISLLHSLNEIKKHVFMPLVGNAIWGERVIGMANLVLANNLPMMRFLVPKTGVTPEMAQLLMSQLKSLEE